MDFWDQITKAQILIDSLISTLIKIIGRRWRWS